MKRFLHILCAGARRIKKSMYKKNERPLYIQTNSPKIVVLRPNASEARRDTHRLAPFVNVFAFQPSFYDLINP